MGGPLQTSREEYTLAANGALQQLLGNLQITWGSTVFQLFVVQPAQYATPTAH